MTTATTQSDGNEAFPQGLQAVMGIDEDPNATGEASAWRLAQDGMASVRLPSQYGLCVGERGSIIVYSDLATGQLNVWHPDAPSANRIIDLPATAGVRRVGDGLALSPDEQLLALVRGERSGESEADIIRGYLIDPESGSVDGWEWFNSLGMGYVARFFWGKDSRSIYLSLDSTGSGGGDRSFRYDFFTGDGMELAGLAVAFDVDLQGQVVGLQHAPSTVTTLPSGAEGGSRPLVLWRDGECLSLPTQSHLVSWDHAWISDDGKTIVVLGDAPHEADVRRCLEVLKLKDDGWKVTGLWTPDESTWLVTGVAFQPNSSVFWFQSGVNAGGGLPTGIRLVSLDTETNKATPSLTLPGEWGDFSIAKGIAGTECRGGN